MLRELKATFLIIAYLFLIIPTTLCRMVTSCLDDTLSDTRMYNRCIEFCHSFKVFLGWW